MHGYLAQFWQQRAPAERRTITLGATLLTIALLYAFIWYPIMQVQQRLQTSLPQMRAAAAQMHIQAIEMRRLRNLPPKSTSWNLRSALESTAAHSPLGAPSQLLALDVNRVRITFNAVAFDSWIEWVKTLQTEQGVRVEAVEILALAEPGMVNIQAVLASSARLP